MENVLEKTQFSDRAFSNTFSVSLLEKSGGSFANGSGQGVGAFAPMPN